jgi:glycerophosphoryl diester phosphodiesterase
MTTSKWAFLDTPLPIAMAHRGVHFEAPENTWQSFSAAQDLGYKYIETDVRGTADGKVIIFHDANARRITGLKRRISQTAFSDLLAKPSAANEAINVPLLDATLDAFPQLRFNIDLKDNIAVEGISEVLRRTDSYDRVCITSFSTRRIRRARKLIGREVCSGAGVSDVIRFWVSRKSGATKQVAPVLQLPMMLGAKRLVSDKLIHKVHDAGSQVHVWTLNDMHSIRTALDAGVDGIVTDEAILLKEELSSRGLWTP